MMKSARVSGMGFGIVAALSALATGCVAADGTDGETTLSLVTQGCTADRDEPSLCTGEARPRPLPARVRRNVILMIGDGRQLEDEIAVSRYLYGQDFALSWDRFPYQASVATWDVTTYNKYAALNGEPAYDPASYDSQVGYDAAQAGALPYPLTTLPGLYAYLSSIKAANGWWAATDSASAATAMSTGFKTDDGNIAWLPGDPADGALTSVGQAVRVGRQMAYGIVSTQAFTAATPAAFAGHNVNRSNYAAIGDEIVFTTQPDVVIGGGYPKLNTPARYTFISQEAYDALASSTTPYRFVERSAGVEGGTALLAAADEAAAGGKKLFGLFGTANSNGIFEIGDAQDTPGAPLVKPGSVENPTLAQASLAALKVLGQNPAGFFLMIEQGDIDTANHANNYKQMIACATDLEQSVAAVIDYVNQPDDDIDWRNTVLLVVSDHATGYMRLNPDVVLGRGDLPAQSGTSYPDGEVSYGTTGHTNELVHLSVAGHMAGALSQCERRDYPGTRILDNTMLHSFVLRAAGL